MKNNTPFLTILFALFIGVLLTMPNLDTHVAHADHGGSHGNSPDQYCIEAYGVWKDAQAWADYACEMYWYAKTDEEKAEWNDECYNANVAAYTAYEYAQAACRGMSIGNL